jgi:hypothetical protein
MQFTPASITDNDHVAVVRVVVLPDSPQYFHGFKDDVEHVVAESEDRKTVIQPLCTVADLREWKNGLGANMQLSGMMAVFAQADVEKLRGLSPKREFFFTVIGAGKHARDFKVKEKFFPEYGD